MLDNQVVEKKLLYLVLASILLHAAIVIALYSIPPEKKPETSEPFMVDLQDIPEQQAVSPPTRDNVRRQAETRNRVTRETAPKGEIEKDKPAMKQLPVQAYPYPRQPAVPSATATGKEAVPQEGLFRRKEQKKVPDVASLYPGATKMAKIEEGYRKKYGPEVEQGDTHFLNTDDILFGSFLRRFETAIYGAWRYPEEAANLGIEGITPVKITFNRNGEIVGKELLQSSGSRILDNEVLRTLDQIGPLGAFPKGYEKDTFKLIAFFHYGIIQGARRTLR